MCYLPAFLSITYYLLPYLSPTTYYLLPTPYNRQPTTYNSHLTTYLPFDLPTYLPTYLLPSLYYVNPLGGAEVPVPVHSAAAWHRQVQGAQGRVERAVRDEL